MSGTGTPWVGAYHPKQRISGLGTCFISESLYVIWVQTILSWGDAINQGILIALSRKNHPELVCAALVRHGIIATLAENIKDTIQQLEASTSAFLLPDLDLDGADLFLDMIVTRFYDTPPYLLVARHYLSSSERTDILKRGADVCLENQ